MPELSKKPRILFFDVGNVFVSDDPSGAYCYRRIYEKVCERQPMSVADFFAWRERHMHAGGDLWKFGRECVGNGDLPAFQKSVRAHIYAHWAEYSPTIPEMEEAVRRLAGTYRLGLLANQPPQIEQVLRDRHMWNLFEVHAISDILGTMKPDRAIFDWALERTGIEASEAMMIGDRLDNDIRPAKELGMQTLWLRIPFDDRGWVPETDFQQAYANSMKSIGPGTRRPTAPENTPDYVATSPRELVEILTQES
jgi:HAD superfamily hydrolase (TIGR01509 family)